MTALPRATEAQVHKAILHWLQRAYPKALVHHSANEVSLSGGAARAAVGKAKGLGMVPGWPDLTILLPGGRAVFIEVKTDGGKLSDAQRDVHARLIAMGFPVSVCRSVDDAQRFMGMVG